MPEPAGVAAAAAVVAPEAVALAAVAVPEVVVPAAASLAVAVVAPGVVPEAVVPAVVSLAVAPLAAATAVVLLAVAELSVAPSVAAEPGYSGNPEMRSSYWCYDNRHRHRQAHSVHLVCYGTCRRYQGHRCERKCRSHLTMLLVVYHDSFHRHLLLVGDLLICYGNWRRSQSPRCGLVVLYMVTSCQPVVCDDRLRRRWWCSDDRLICR